MVYSECRHWAALPHCLSGSSGHHFSSIISSASLLQLVSSLSSLSLHDVFVVLVFVLSAIAESAILVIGVHPRAAHIAFVCLVTGKFGSSADL